MRQDHPRAGAHYPSLVRSVGEVQFWFVGHIGALSGSPDVVPRHGTLSIPSSGHSTFFEIRQLDFSLAHLGHLPGARHLLDARAGPRGPEVPASTEAVTPCMQVEKVAMFLLRRTYTAL